MAMQDAREVAVAVDRPSVCYDDYETNYSEGHSEPEETAAWQGALPPPDPARESDAPYESVHRHKERNHPTVVDAVSAKPESPLGWVEGDERGTQYLHQLIEGVRYRRSALSMVESCELQYGQRNQSHGLTSPGNCREHEMPPPRSGVPSIGLLKHLHCHLTSTLSSRRASSASLWSAGAFSSTVPARTDHARWNTSSKK